MNYTNQHFDVPLLKGLYIPIFRGHTYFAYPSGLNKGNKGLKSEQNIEVKILISYRHKRVIEQVLSHITHYAITL